MSDEVGCWNDLAEKVTRLVNELTDARETIAALKRSLQTACTARKIAEQQANAHALEASKLRTRLDEIERRGNKNED